MRDKYEYDYYDNNNNSNNYVYVESVIHLMREPLNLFRHDLQRFATK